jgi:hypothetical protein
MLDIVEVTGNSTRCHLATFLLLSEGGKSTVTFFGNSMGIKFVTKLTYHDNHSQLLVT